MKSEVRHNSVVTSRIKKIIIIASEYFKTIPQRGEVELGLGTSPLKDEWATACK